MYRKINLDENKVLLYLGGRMVTASVVKDIKTHFDVSDNTIKRCLKKLAQTKNIVFDKTKPKKWNTQQALGLINSDPITPKIASSLSELFGVSEQVIRSRLNTLKKDNKIKYAPDYEIPTKKSYSLKRKFTGEILSTVVENKYVIGPKLEAIVTLPAEKSVAENYIDAIILLTQRSQRTVIAEEKLSHIIEEHNKRIKRIQGQHEADSKTWQSALADRDKTIRFLQSKLAVLDTANLQLRSAGALVKNGD